MPLKLKTAGGGNVILAGSSTVSDKTLTLPASDGTAIIQDSSGVVDITATGGRIRGDFSNATTANRVAFQTSTVNGVTNLYAIPNGTATTSRIGVTNNSDPTNSGVFSLGALSTEVRFDSSKLGTGTYLPMTFYTGGSERMRVDTSGNVGIGTNSPAEKLDVVGNASISGDLSLTGNASGILKSGTAQIAPFANTSSINFTGIPATAKRITVIITGLSYAAAGAGGVQIGSGTLTTTGYTSGTSAQVGTPAINVGSQTTNFGILTTNAAGTTVTATYVLHNITGNTWVFSEVGFRFTDNISIIGSGFITLGGVLDRLSVVATVSTFDAGTVNIFWE